MPAFPHFRATPEKKAHLPGKSPPLHRAMTEIRTADHGCSYPPRNELSRQSRTSVTWFQRDRVTGLRRARGTDSSGRKWDIRRDGKAGSGPDSPSHAALSAETSAVLKSPGERALSAVRRPVAWRRVCWNSWKREVRWMWWTAYRS